MNLFYFATMVFVFSGCSDITQPSVNTNVETQNQNVLERTQEESSTEVPRVELKTWKSGVSFSVEDGKEYFIKVVKSRKEYESLQAQYPYLSLMNEKLLKEVDFARSWLLVTQTNQKMSSGYGVKNVSVQNGVNEVSFDIVETEPGKGCMTAQVMSTPYNISVMSHTNKQMKFSWKKEFLHCE